MNRNQFQQAAKKFRAGKLTLEEFTQQVMAREDAGPTSAKSAESTAKIVLPLRAKDGHKGDFGRVLVIGGSHGMAGAPGLSGLAALRSGAGLVTVAVPDVCLSIVASFNPCLMTVALSSDDGKINGENHLIIQDLIERADVVALGPGLGQSDSINELVLRFYQECDKPMVFDADALNALAQANPGCVSKHSGPRILTPHPGEFQRLAGRQFHSREEMCAAADEYAAKSNTYIVLKGHETHITDGKQTERNSTGNAGMATAGSGDVLTGIIAAMMGQNLPVFEAVVAACYVHGLAGDLAAMKLGQHSLIATDLIDHLSESIMAIARSH